jgi:FkbM family methyltransferase
MSNSTNLSQSKADENDIHYAYRMLLGRNPDPAGLEHHRRLLSESALLPEELARLFLASVEFAARNNKAPLEIPLDGYSIFIRPEDHDIGQAVQRHGHYEPHVTTIVRERLKNGHIFVDVGANIGYFTMLAAHLVGSSGAVWAIEPMDKNLQLIYRGIARNGFGHVHVIACAASDRREVVRVATGPGTSNGQVENLASGSDALLYSQTERLDELLVGLGGLNLLKLDIEGFEPKAWDGLRRTLERYRPTVLTEFHPYCMRNYAGIEPEIYLRELFCYGHEIYHLHHDGSRIRCPDVAAVLKQWESSDKAARNDGTDHIDLLVESS